jgi:hypothetical protein
MHVSHAAMNVLEQATLLRPSRMVFHSSALDAGYGVIETFSQFSVFPMVDLNYMVIPIQFTDRRDDRSCTGTKSFIQLTLA